MKKLLLLFSFTGFLNSCSSIQGVSGRVITPDGEFTVQPDGRIEIVVNPITTK